MKTTANPLVEQVLRGLAQDWSQFESMDRAVVTLMRDAKSAGEETFKGSAPGDWEARWIELQTTLDQMRAHAARTRQLIESDRALSGGDAPLDEWREISRRDAAIDSILPAMRAACEPPRDAPHRARWEAAWNALDSYLRAMRAHTAAMTVKLEMHRRYGQKEAGRLTEAILSRLPDGSPHFVEPARFEEVAFQLHEEHHEFKGFGDVVRALLMFWETPDERLAKK
jgi:hypothetical protein